MLGREVSGIHQSNDQTVKAPLDRTVVIERSHDLLIILLLVLIFMAEPCRRKASTAVTGGIAMTTYPKLALNA